MVIKVNMGKRGETVCQDYLKDQEKERLWKKIEKSVKELNKKCGFTTLQYKKELLDKMKGKRK